MWLTKLFTALLVAFTGLLPSSCTKASKLKAQSPKPVINIVAASGSSTNRSLGDLRMRNHYETFVDLGAGKSCTIKPNLLDSHNLQLTFSLVSKETNGVIKDLNVMQLLTKSGTLSEVALGGIKLSFTPNVTTD